MADFTTNANLTTQSPFPLLCPALAMRFEVVPGLNNYISYNSLYSTDLSITSIPDGTYTFKLNFYDMVPDQAYPGSLIVKNGVVSKQFTPFPDGLISDLSSQTSNQLTIPINFTFMIITILIVPALYQRLQRLKNSNNRKAERKFLQ